MVSSPLPARGTVDDAVVSDPDATYERAADLPVLTDRQDRAVVSELLGRPSRGESAVAHRCAHGLPSVIRVGPRLHDGTPFPTVFWSSCPRLNSAVGRLEADHVMVGVNERLAEDPDFAEAYASGSQRYVAFRDELGGRLPGDPSAGGMPGHVKCLHVAVGHELAVNDNPVGRVALDMAGPVPCPAPCVDAEAAEGRWGPRLDRIDATPRRPGPPADPPADQVDGEDATETQESP